MAGITSIDSAPIGGSFEVVACDLDLMVAVFEDAITDGWERSQLHWPSRRIKASMRLMLCDAQATRYGDGYVSDNWRRRSTLVARPIPVSERTWRRIRLGRSFLVSLRGLLALAGLATGFAVFSGCANGGFTSTSGRQQKTLVKTNARDQGDPYPRYFVDWRKSARDQPGETYPTYEGIGTPWCDNGTGTAETS
jgi:hypothetical protein